MKISFKDMKEGLSLLKDSVEETLLFFRKRFKDLGIIIPHPITYSVLPDEENLSDVDKVIRCIRRVCNRYNDILRIWDNYSKFLKEELKDVDLDRVSGDNPICLQEEDKESKEYLLMRHIAGINGRLTVLIEALEEAIIDLPDGMIFEEKES